jgi:hypothetical protein
LYEYIFIVIGEKLLFPKFLGARRVTLCLLQWQVDLQLRDVPFEGNNTKNANNMQEMADVKGDLLKDAAMKKLKIKFKMREVMEEINVALLTRAYVTDGMNALRPDSTVKSKKRSQKTRRHINTAAWSKIRKLASGEASGEESGEKDNIADPIATSSRTSLSFFARFVLWFALVCFESTCG